MLANGITLGYREAATGAYTNLAGLKEVPQIGSDTELIENSPLNATTKQYESGVGDLPSQEYVFIYDNESATSTYRVMRGYADSKTKLYFEEKFSDGTTFTFQAIPSVKLSGGGLNDPIDLTVTLAIKSDITVTDPS